MFHHTRTRHRKYGPWLLGSATALRRRGCECLANPVAAASAKFTILQNSSQSNTVLPLLRVNNWVFSVLRRNKSKTICRTLRSPLPRTMAMTWGGEAWKILKGIATQPFCNITNWNQPFKGIRIGILISWLWGAEVMTFRFCSAPAARWSRIGIKLVTVFCFRPSWKARKLGSRLSSKSLASINLSISSASVNHSWCTSFTPSMWQFSDLGSPNGGHRRWHSWRSQTSVPSVKLCHLTTWPSKRLKSILASRLTLPLPPAFTSLILASLQAEDLKKIWKFDFTMEVSIYDIYKFPLSVWA